MKTATRLNYVHSYWRTTIPLIVGVVLSACAGMAPNDLRLPFPREFGFFVQPPDGGDCEILPVVGGTWNAQDSTCTWSGGLIFEDQTLTIRRGANLVVPSQLVNHGNINIIGDGPGGAELIVGIQNSPGFGAFVNSGNLYIFPNPPPAVSPGFSNYSVMQNQTTGVVVNFFAEVDGVRNSGVFNNFGTIHNAGSILNVGFFHNSGPPVQSELAHIDTTGGFFFNSGNGGALENLGVIDGPISNSGTCTGNCP